MTGRSTAQQALVYCTHEKQPVITTGQDNCCIILMTGTVHVMPHQEIY